ncbi:uncharacterized protein LOC130801810 [Amaranthus tricolor]|uniref:uncharacterized protein LOC130801810 n=1 Tax=Amaranthus tricolor TaxID=29722 RepID=UPI0025891EE1|nr:uncharacterized protein LOC130801810 [Amaranthus tricolor]
MVEIEQDHQLTRKIALILDESKASYATHNRKLKELCNLRSSSPQPQTFFSSFRKALLPIFTFQRRTASAERIIRFVCTFACFTDSKRTSIDFHDDFLETFLRFLLTFVSANKTARFRSCQIISEIIMRLPDDAEVSNELWDEVTESMVVRVGDKIPIIRTYAVRALSRFVNDSENSDILDLFIQTLDSEQNADVRKTILLSLPPTNTTSSVIIGCTLDVSESVRKAAYIVLANKFPLQSLSIKLRASILQRGLSDRSPAVVKECVKLLIDEWLCKSCNSNPVELLKYLDVETYESVGVSVMRALLGAGMGKPEETQKIQQYKDSCDEAEVSNCNHGVKLLEPELALYWRVVCQHFHTEALVKGSDAAATTGTEATVYAAEATSYNELLEKFLPATVSDYVDLVQAHITMGANYHFASRQLLLIGALLDFSDATIRRTASTFVQDLLHKPLEYEVDSSGNKIIIGDGINLGGDRDWAIAVAGLVKKVHAADGEFEEVILQVVEELARSCRERTADFLEWLHCLAVIGLLLENTKSLHILLGKAIEPTELLNALLLPGAKHLNLDVQRVALRCLGLYGLLERRPSVEVVKQLAFSFVKGPSSISLLAGKGLMDLLMWHDPQEVDKALGQEFFTQLDNGLHQTSDMCNKIDGFNFGVLYLLYVGLERDFVDQTLDVEENESVQATLGEGFAKILLLSESYPSIPDSLHSLILVKLITLYFSRENIEIPRLKQCLSVFFEHYPSLSSNHKKHLSKAFVPVMRAMWPGIDGNHGGSNNLISNMRKRAVQASRFMLQMMQSTLYQKETNEHVNSYPEENTGCVENSDGFEAGQEGLALRIATEVVSFALKKTASEKSYVSALCKAIVLLHFRESEQGTIKLMRLLLNRIIGSISYEKELVKELTNMAQHLRKLDCNPDEKLTRENAEFILGRLNLEYNLSEDHSIEIPPTPAPRPTQPSRSRRRTQREESSSDEEVSPTTVVPSTVRSGARSQRASKTAALTKMTSNRAYDDIEEEGEGSDLTSQEEATDSDSSTQ